MAISGSKWIRKYCEVLWGTMTGLQANLSFDLARQVREKSSTRMLEIATCKTFFKRTFFCHSDWFDFNSYSYSAKHLSDHSLNRFVTDSQWFWSSKLQHHDQWWCFCLDIRWNSRFNVWRWIFIAQQRDDFQFRSTLEHLREPTLFRHIIHQQYGHS